MAVVRRDQRSGSRQGARPQSGKKGTIVLNQVVDEIRALNSSIALISQKIKHLVRNEKILGRNLIVLNKKVKSFSDTKVVSGSVPDGVEEQLRAFQRQMDENSRKIDDAISTIEALKNDFVTSEELKELRYVIDSINPLEFVTIDQAKDLIDEKISKSKAKTVKK